MNTLSRYSYPAQLAMLLLFTGLSLMIGSFITIGLAVVIFHVPITEMQTIIETSNNVYLIRFVQVFSTIFALGVPCIAFAAVTSKQPLKRLGFFRLSIRQVYLAILIAATCLLAGNFFSRINEAIPLSQKTVAYFTSLELNYAKQILAIANMQGTVDYILSILIIAFLPAFIEELFFRGCLQKLLVDWIRKPFVAILITSIVFSAIHASFYGFLPRVFLGMALGYIFYFGKSIWLNILAHFINNGVAITALYFTSRTEKITVEAIMKQEQLPYYLSFVALLMVVWLLIKLRKASVSSETVINESDIPNY